MRQYVPVAADISRRSVARLVRAQLYGIAPGDPRMLLYGAAILLATVLAASLLPALRASRVTPVEALREE